MGSFFTFLSRNRAPRGRSGEAQRILGSSETGRTQGLPGIVSSFPRRPSPSPDKEGMGSSVPRFEVSRTFLVSSPTEMSDPPSVSLPDKVTTPSVRVYGVVRSDLNMEDERTLEGDVWRGPSVKVWSSGVGLLVVGETGTTGLRVRVRVGVLPGSLLHRRGSEGVVRGHPGLMSGLEGRSPCRGSLELGPRDSTGRTKICRR